MPHRERHTWVEEISKINKKINQSAGAVGPRVGSPAVSQLGPLAGGGLSVGQAGPVSGFDLTQPDDDEGG